MSLPALLYAEDDAALAEMVVEVLSEHYSVTHVADGDAALRHALNERFAVIVLDRRLPGPSGLDLVGSIRTARIATPILMLTALGTIDDRVEGLDAGADDYLVKPFAYEELLARLRALTRAFTAMGERLSIGEWLFTPKTRTLYSPTGLRVLLTDTETALLRALAESPEHIFSRGELLDAVFNDTEENASIGAGSVDTYVHYVRRKADPEIIETVRGRGYRLGSAG